MKAESREQQLQAYLDRDYPFVVYRAEEGGYVAEVPELPGCITQGETLEEVEQRIKDACRAWIQVAFEEGQEIPLPRGNEAYSGKFVVRLPRYLHRRLAEQAAKERTSLNQYVAALLSSRSAVAEIGPIVEEATKKVLEKQRNSLLAVEGLGAYWRCHTGEIHPSLPEVGTAHQLGASTWVREPQAA